VFGWFRLTQIEGLGRNKRQKATNQNWKLEMFSFATVAQLNKLNKLRHVFPAQLYMTQRIHHFSHL
jgi:hypothetical protein